VVPIDPSTVNFVTHLEFQEKISMVFPENWNRDSSFSEPELLVVFIEPSEGPTDQFLENVALVKVDNMTEVIDSGEVTNIQEISSIPIDIAGFSGQEEIFDADVAGAEALDLRFMLIGFEFNGFVYALLYSAERSVFERNIEIVRHMASRLNLGQVIFSDMPSSSDLTKPGKIAIANDGENFLLVSCREAVNLTGPELVGRIVRIDRSMNDEFSIYSGGGTENCTFISHNVTFDGNNYLVTYSTTHDGNRRILGTRISPVGGLVDNVPIDISRNENGSALESTLAFDGSRSLVVWHERGATEDIKGAFIDANGSVTSSFTIESNLVARYSDPNILIVTPQVAYGNLQYMVIWSPYFSQSFDTEPIYGQQIDLSGNLLLPDAIEIRSDTGEINPRYAQIATDGSSYLIGWIEGFLQPSVTSTGRFSVYARQVSASGELQNGNASELGVEIAPEVELSKDFLDLSFDNGNYLFLWSAVGPDPETGVYGVQVSADLSNISPPVPIVGTDADTILGDLTAPSQANISYSNERSFSVWPSRGEVEGWFIENITFD
jgi:hypothetical protein